MIREPQAPNFYPQSERELIGIIEKLLDSVETPNKYLGGIAPHTNYMYAGLSAAALYKALKKSKRIIILGDDHYGNAFEISTHPYSTWKTPLGEVNVAKELNDKLELIEVENPKEYSIEVQLPFLQHLWGDFEFFPITIPKTPLNEIENFGEKLRKLKLPIIATTELSHNIPKNIAVENDAKAIDTIIKGNALELMRVLDEQRITMCGMFPTLVFLEATRGMEKELLLYYTSGDIVGSEKSVSSYVSIGVK